MSLTIPPIVAYIAHDAVGRTEGYITDYDKEALAQAEASGIVILAERADGSRQIVCAEDVEKPKPMANGDELTTSETFGGTMDAVVACFDALAGEQGISTLSAKSARKTFAQALAELKALLGGDADGNA